MPSPLPTPGITGWAGRPRNETSEALSLVTRAMLWDVPGRPSEDVLHRALRLWAFLGPGASDHDIPAQDRLVLAWVAKASRPLVDPYTILFCPRACWRPCAASAT